MESNPHGNTRDFVGHLWEVLALESIDLSHVGEDDLCQYNIDFDETKFLYLELQVEDLSSVWISTPLEFRSSESSDWIAIPAVQTKMEEYDRQLVESLGRLVLEHLDIRKDDL